MIMGSRRYGARFGTAVANVGDLNSDGYEGKQWSYTLYIKNESIRRTTDENARLFKNQTSFLRFFIQFLLEI
jgi:hypothetical protein